MAKRRSAELPGVSDSPRELSNPVPYMDEPSWLKPLAEEALEEVVGVGVGGGGGGVSILHFADLPVNEFELKIFLRDRGRKDRSAKSVKKSYYYSRISKFLQLKEGRNTGTTCGCHLHAKFEIPYTMGIRAHGSRH